MEGHASVAFLAALIGELTEREEAADERPVGIDSAAFRAEKYAAPVGFVAENAGSFFRILPIEFGRGEADVFRQPDRLIRADADRLVGAAGAADLALERKRAIELEVENKRRGKPTFVHRFGAPILIQAMSRVNEIVQA